MLPTVSGEFGVVRDPEMKFTEKGTAWAKIRCSAKDRKRDANGQWTDTDPLFINVIVGNGAEHLVESIRVGDSITVQGRLKMREYEVDGQKKQEYQIAADTIGVSLRWGPAKTARALEDAPLTVAAVADAFQATEAPF
jgi:single-strand DNA-binding protein